MSAAMLLERGRNMAANGWGSPLSILVAIDGFFPPAHAAALGLLDRAARETGATTLASWRGTPEQAVALFDEAIFNANLEGK